ncbi:MAG: hypothetical protein GC200_08480 [Tepidisphaera sp.]|nr:hypothetical protein [Tepidisphaera sp.]
MALSPIPICFRCGIDVSTSRRFKDAAGKFYCEACAQALQRRRAKIAQVASRSTAAPASEGEYTLEPVEEAVTRAPCPKCASSFQPGRADCPVCGYDPASVPLNPEKAREVLGDFDAHPDDTAESREERRKRKQQREEAEARRNVPHCKKCDYELSGLPTDKRGGMKCPECGTLNRFYTRLQHDEMVSREMEKAAFRKPLIFLTIGGGTYGAYLLYEAAMAAQASISPGAAALGLTTSGPDYTKAIAIVAAGLGLFVGATVIGLIALLVVARFLMGGVDSHLKHTTLFVASAMSCALAFFAIGDAVTHGLIFLLPLGITTFMYAALLADFVDLELRDARIVSFVTWVIIFVLALFI